MYRFQDIIGQPDAVGHLQNALREGQISHAYILTGDKGLGKMKLAMAFAQTLQCTDRKEINGLLEPCGICHSCMQVESMSQPDIMVVSNDLLPASQRKNSIGIDLIRMMVSDVGIKPYSDDWKVYIIPDAEKMTVQSQNALLKTLEEPPEYAVILLLANELTSFLPTVLSRCVTLKLRSIDSESMMDYLTGPMQLTDVRASLIAGLAHGNPGRAEYLCRSDAFEELRRKTVRLLEGLARTDSHSIVQFTEELAPSAKSKASEKKEAKSSQDAGESEQVQILPADPVGDFLDLVQSWYRDLLVAKSTGACDNLIFSDEVQYIKDAVKGVSFETLERITRAIALAERRRSTGGKDSQILELMLLEIRSALRVR